MHFMFYNRLRFESNIFLYDQILIFRKILTVSPFTFSLVHSLPLRVAIISIGILLNVTKISYFLGKDKRK